MLIPSLKTPQTGNAALAVASGLPTQPGIVNPLAGKGVVLFRESFGGFLKRKGMFQGPPGSTIKQSPLAVWAYACQTGSPVCQQALYEMRPNAVAETRMDQNAKATLPSVPVGARKGEQLGLKVRQCDFFRNLIVFNKKKSGRPRLVEINSEVKSILLQLCKSKRPDDYVWVNPVTGGPYTDIKHAFTGACLDANIEGLVWHDLRATYGTRLGEAGFNAYDIAKLMGHANISTSQRYVHNLPVGSGEAVLLKNQRRHNTVTSEDSKTLTVVANS